MGEPFLTYFGVLRSISSWAKVSRELLASLFRLGTEINIYERKGFLYDPFFPLPPELEKTISNEFKGKVVLTFENPRVYNYLPCNTFNIGLLVYEFTILPDEWVSAINQYLTIVLVPSSFCRRVFIDSGVNPSKVKVLRYGYNPDLYYAAEDCRDEKYTFLSIANPHHREGIDLLLEAFELAFAPEEKVRLKLKLTYLPSTKPKQFEYGNLSDLLSRLSTSPSGRELQILHERFSDNEMASLYRSAHSYVSLSRCEAFGLCFLEALASGLQVVAANWGGQADFLNDTNSHLIPYTLTSASAASYYSPAENQLMALPDVGATAALMRALYQGQLKVTPFLSPSSSHWHWSSIATDLLSLISDYLPSL